jgi:hypothetical protein
VALHLLVFFVHSCAVDGRAQTIESVRIEPRCTFLRTDSIDTACDAAPIYLAGRGIFAGDSIALGRVGAFSYNGARDETDGMIGVFSATSVLLPPNVLARVPDAIPVGVNPVDDGVSHFEQLPRDIPEDFFIDGNTTVTVPPGAAFLFVCSLDTAYFDNLDIDKDYGLVLPDNGAFAELTWDPPSDADLGPPENLVAVVGSPGTRGKRNAGSPGRAQAGDVIAYKVYTSDEPNVGSTPDNLYTTLPPSMTRSRAPIGSRGSFYIVTACYPEGESPPSNETSAGTPGAVVRKVRIGQRIVAKGDGFSDTVRVFIDGVPFEAPSTVKALAKVIQKGRLVTGQSVLDYIGTQRDHEIVFVNSDQSLTRVPFRRP